MASLTAANFQLTSAKPTLTINAACSQHRRKDDLPLHPQLDPKIKAWLAEISPSTPRHF
jgi:hypothetical protein